MSVPEDQIFARLGDAGFARLVAAFYKQVPTDPVLGPMYPADDLANAEWRLREFLIGRFGGPARYIEQRGHPRLRMRHAPFAVTPTAREHWIKLMTHAMAEVNLEEEVAATLLAYFEQTATFMINRPASV